ncbi:MAG: tyrosine-protein phosphatase [Rhodospirillaceae bacterium]|nr:tyrosine-protein phosphatase [Rhodospirillaceae bacterium]
MQRHLPFDGVINFRDFGGYATADGGRVRWKKLYRSAHLANLTDADHARMKELGIAAICDFRTVEESEKGPSRLPADTVFDRLHLDIWPAATHRPTVVARALLDGDSIESVFESQRKMYRSLVADFPDRYATMFQQILRAQGRPILIHCRGGRDRTGFGAAIILFALGVPEETVIEDYLRTNASAGANDFVGTLAERYASAEKGRTRADLEALFGRVFPVRAENLKAAFEEVHARHGSIDGYLRDAVKVGAPERAKLREWFLE